MWPRETYRPARRSYTITSPSSPGMSGYVDSRLALPGDLGERDALRSPSSTSFPFSPFPLGLDTGTWVNATSPLQFSVSASSSTGTAALVFKHSPSVFQHFAVPSSSDCEKIIRSSPENARAVISPVCAFSFPNVRKGSAPSSFLAKTMLPPRTYTLYVPPLDRAVALPALAAASSTGPPAPEHAAPTSGSSNSPLPS